MFVDNFGPKISRYVYTAMSPAVGVLCAVILCLVLYIVYQRKTAATPSAPAPAESMSGGHDGRHPPRCPCNKCISPESQAMGENIEHFASCATSCDTGTIDAAVEEFGGTGGDFRDWVASQAVDAQILVNHREFVKDRLGNNNQNITGRTYAMGEVEGTDQVPWQGIRGRPQAVETCNPPQVPDVDMRNFTTKPRFNWTSS